MIVDRNSAFLDVFDLAMLLVAATWRPIIPDSEPAELLGRLWSGLAAANPALAAAAFNIALSDGGHLPSIVGPVAEAVAAGKQPQGDPR